MRRGARGACLGRTHGQDAARPRPRAGEHLNGKNTKSRTWPSYVGAGCARSAPTQVGLLRHWWAAVQQWQHDGVAAAMRGWWWRFFPPGKAQARARAPPARAAPARRPRRRARRVAAARAVGQPRSHRRRRRRVALRRCGAAHSRPGCWGRCSGRASCSRSARSARRMSGSRLAPVVSIALVNVAKDEWPSKWSHSKCSHRKCSHRKCSHSKCSHSKCSHSKGQPSRTAVEVRSMPSHPSW